MVRWFGLRFWILILGLIKTGMSYKSDRVFGFFKGVRVFSFLKSSELMLSLLDPFKSVLLLHDLLSLYSFDLGWIASAEGRVKVRVKGVWSCWVCKVLVHLLGGLSWRHYLLWVLGRVSVVLLGSEVNGLDAFIGIERVDRMQFSSSVHLIRTLKVNLGHLILEERDEREDAASVLVKTCTEVVCLIEIWLIVCVPVPSLILRASNWRGISLPRILDSPRVLALFIKVAALGNIRVEILSDISLLKLIWW